MIRGPPRSTLDRSSAASDVYKRQEPGDLFWFNECSIAGMHPADVYDILPIFWHGELVAWVVTVIMEMDIGAISPGCMPVPNIERATDGIRFAGEKVGTRDQLRHDLHLSLIHISEPTRPY